MCIICEFFVHLLYCGIFSFSSYFESYYCCIQEEELCFCLDEKENFVFENIFDIEYRPNSIKTEANFLDLTFALMEHFLSHLS